MKNRTALLAFATGAALTWSAETAYAKPSIRSVYFDGEPLAPVLVIHGSGFGVEPATKTNPPPPHTGFNYGSDLHFQNEASHPYVFSAGYVNAREARLDLVGLTVEYSNDLIKLSFGSFFTANGYQLREGDSYKLTVKGATFTGTVEYSRAKAAERCPINRVLTCRPAGTAGQGYGKATVRGLLYDSLVDVKYGLYKCQSSSAEKCSFSGPGRPGTCDLFGVRTEYKFIADTGVHRWVPTGVFDFVVDPARPSDYPPEMFEAIRDQVLNCQVKGACPVIAPKCD